MTDEQILNIFTYHKPITNQRTRYETLRDDGKHLAFAIQSMCPESREKSLAITKLQECIMWANASIAINEQDYSDPPPLEHGEAKETFDMQALASLRKKEGSY